MGNAWYVSPFDAEWVASTNPLRVEAGSPGETSVGPSPSQVFAMVQEFPEYQVSIHRRDRKEKGQAVYIGLKRLDGSHAVDIHLLRVYDDEKPAGVFVFDYYQSTNELVRLVSKLAEECGPLVLWHDSGGEQSILVMPDGKELTGS